MITDYSIRSFMSNVNKLDETVHTKTHSKTFGTVALKTPAYASTTGKRMFTLSGSKVAHNGAYSFAGLKAAFEKAM